jgi:hypothetical protein
MTQPGRWPHPAWRLAAGDPSWRHGLARRWLRTAARGGWAAAADVLHPILVILRGARNACCLGYDWWQRTPADSRRTALAAAVLGTVGLFALPYGPLVLLAGAGLAAAWLGRDRPAAAPSAAHERRLAAVRAALTPLRGVGFGAHPTVTRCRFDDRDHLIDLDVRLPSAATTGRDPAALARLERAIAVAAGPANEYGFTWDWPRRRLAVQALPALPWGVPVRCPGDAIVLGATDGPDGTSVACPLPADTSPGLLVTAEPAAGVRHLLRALAAQALAHGAEVTLLAGADHDDYRCLTGHRPGLRLARSPVERRAALADCLAGGSPRSAMGGPGPDQPQTGRVCAPPRRWLIVDGLGADLPAIRALLAGPVRPDLLVVLAERPGRTPEWLPGHFTARVALGPLQLAAAPAADHPGIAGGGALPPGRGYAWIGGAPAVRLQTPYAPDPLAPGTPERDRAWLARLLPAPPIAPVR